MIDLRKPPRVTSVAAFCLSASPLSSSPAQAGDPVIGAGAEKSRGLSLLDARFRGHDETEILR
jgi:hypothetical protein